MTNRNARPRWIAVALVALALLAVVAWRQRPDVLQIGSVQSTQAMAAKAATPESQSGTETQTPARRNDASVGSSMDKDASAICDRDYRQNLRDYRDRLGPARNADEAVDRVFLDSLAAFGTRDAFNAFERGYRAARQRWPDDLELSWLGLDHCGKGCDHDAQVRHLLSVDPDNAAAWMVAMSTARSDHDEAGFAYALQRAASAKIYDSRMGVVFLHARTMFARVPVPDSCLTPQSLAGLRGDVGREPTNDDRIDIMAFAMEAAIGMPALSGMTPCIPRPSTLSLPDAQRR
jgi:hypothetical protein